MKFRGAVKVCAKKEMVLDCGARGSISATFEMRNGFAFPGAALNPRETGGLPVRVGVGLRTRGDKVKIAMAKRMRKETTMALKWIAPSLQMGIWIYVFDLLPANHDQKR